MGNGSVNIIVLFDQPLEQGQGRHRLRLHCEKFRADCYKEIARIFGVGGGVDAGSKVCAYGIGTWIAHQFSKGFAKVVAGVGAVHTLFSLGSKTKDALERKDQCATLYEKCVDKVSSAE